MAATKRKTRKSKKPQRDHYQDVTDKIIEQLEKGVVPWKHPVAIKAGLPASINGKRPYRGVNVFLLTITALSEGYNSRYWATYNQAKKLGGQVREGEKGTSVVLWQFIRKTDTEDTGEKVEKVIPILKFWTVFNLDQIDGLDDPDVGQEREHTPIEAAEQIIEGWGERPPVDYQGHQPCYIPSEDRLRMPKPEHFVGDEEYYSTAFHEYAHATGHPDRLKRWEKDDKVSFGSESYSKEELVAEMTAAFLCAEAEIAPATIENSAAYIKSWLKRLKDDKKLIISAAGQAQKAADLILNKKPYGENDEDE
jgi:antirestriction protein ArdC